MEHAGRRVAWTRDRQRVVAVADSFADVMSQAIRSGERDPYVKKLPGVSPGGARKPVVTLEDESSNIIDDVSKVVPDAEIWLDSPNSSLGGQRLRPDRHRDGAGGARPAPGHQRRNHDVNPRRRRKTTTAQRLGARDRAVVDLPPNPHQYRPPKATPSRFSPGRSPTPVRDPEFVASPHNSQFQLGGQARHPLAAGGRSRRPSVGRRHVTRWSCSESRT